MSQPTGEGSPLYESSFGVAINGHPLSILEARQISHDMVIANAGRARLSGVVWTERPLVGWRDALDEIGIEVDEHRERPPHDVEYMAERYPNGVLVIATVEVDPAVKP